MEETFDWDDYNFQRQMDLQAIADTLTLDEYLEHPDLINLTRRPYGGPIRTRSNFNRQSRDNAVNLTTRLLQERAEFLETQRLQIEKNREQRMLSEIDAYIEDQDAYWSARAKRNRNIALLKLQFKRELNK